MMVATSVASAPLVATSAVALSKGRLVAEVPRPFLVKVCEC